MPRFLLITDSSGDSLQEACKWPAGCELVPAGPAEFTVRVTEGGFDGIILSASLAVKRAGIGLFESEAVLDQLPDGVALLDVQGTVLRCNQKLREWFGDQLIGRNFHDSMGNPRVLGPTKAPLWPVAKRGFWRPP